MRLRLRVRVAPVLLSCLALGAPIAGADVLVPTSGRPVQGAVVSQDGDTVVFNPYWSRNPEMAYEVLRLPRSRVKRIEIEPHVPVEVFRRIERAAGDPDALVAIAAYAKENREKAHARICLGLALAADPEHADALKGIGGRAKWEAPEAGESSLRSEPAGGHRRLRRRGGRRPPRAEGSRAEVEAVSP